MRKLMTGLSLICMAAAGGLMSCSDESPWGGGEGDSGTISLRMTSDSRVMRGGTRADDTMCPVIPDANAFAISLKSADGSYSKTWANIDAFNKEKSFPMGDYRIEATYGDMEREGFELPYYSGVNDVHVSPGANSDVSVCATLANAMVSVRYTDKFTQNFSAYSAAVQTAGHDWVVFAQNENRPAFIDPSDGEVKMSLTLTNASGKRVTIEPASFQAMPRHHYVVTINATGSTESGDLALDVQFDDEVVNETVTVSLGDELFTAPAPEVRAKNFTDKEELSLFEYETIPVSPQFDIFAFGGFGGVTLTVISNNGYTPAFGSSVELLNAPDLTQQQLKSAGVDVAGLFRNADKMGVVKIKNFIENLPAGEYTVQLQAKDAMTRLSEPVQLTAKIGRVDYTLTGEGSLAFRGTEAVVTVCSNSQLIKDKISFKAPDEHNRMVEAKVKSVETVTAPEGSLPYAYRFVLEVAPVSAALIDVEATYGKLTRSVSLSVAEPDYTLDCDGFARFAVIRVNASDAALRDYIVKNGALYNGNTQIGAGNIRRDADNGFITVSGLTPSATYDALKVSLGAFRKDVPSFATEAEAAVPNGNFSEADDALRLTFTDLQVGGKYIVGAIDKYRNVVNINLQQPAGWASLNDLTFYSGSTCKNSWFMVPSTFLNSGMVTLRSVGYSHNGTEPALTGEFWTTTYYNTNSPAKSDLSISAGELFLGSYSVAGGKNMGMAFSSRPVSLQFDYKYTPVNGEQAEVEFRVTDAQGNVIGTASRKLSATPDMTTATVAIPSYPFGKKAAKLYVCFRSTAEGVTPEVNIPSGSQLKEWEGTLPVTPYKHHLPENTYHTFAVGSVLVLDNVKLGYTEPVTVTKAPRRNLKKK